MAKITPPRERLVQGSQGISTTGNVSGINIGRQTQALGQAVTSAGADLSRVADQAFKQAIYSRALNQATRKFNDSYIKRVQQRLDENGNPTFHTLVDDTGKLGKEALDEALGNISDPVVKSKLTSNFNNYVTNRQLLAQTSARKQQIEFTRAGLFEGIDGLKQQAFEDDPVNAPQYKSDINDMIESGLATGALSPLEASKIKESAMEEINVRHLEDSVRDDPLNTLTVLQASKPTDLGISEGSHDRLIFQAQKEVNQQQKILEKQRADEERILKEKQSLAAGELEIGVIESSVGQSEIEQAFSRGTINEKQKIDLIKKVVRRDVTERRKQKSFKEISDAIDNGLPLTRFSSSKINNHYQQRVDELTDPETGQPASILEKAKIASSYKAPVVAFAKEVSFGLQNGTDEQAIQAARAYQFVSQRQPLAVDTPSISKESKAIAATYTALSEGSKISDQEAIRIARRQVLEKDNEIIKSRSDEVSKIGDFNEDLEDTVKQMFDTNKGFIDFPGGEADSVSQEAMQTFKRLFRTAYIETGDKDAAIEFVRNETASLYGPSKVNGPNSEIMFLPPEKLYPGVSSEDIRQEIITEAESLDLPDGVSPQDVKITSDTLSRSDPNIISYGVYYEDEFGNKIPIYDKEGDLARYEVSRFVAAGRAVGISVRGSAVRSAAQQKFEEMFGPSNTNPTTIDEAISRRQDIIRSGSGTGNGPLGVSGRFISKFGKATERRVQEAEVGAEENQAELTPEEMDSHQLNTGKPEPIQINNLSQQILDQVINQKGGIVNRRQKQVFFNKYRTKFGKLKQKQVAPLENLISKVVDDKRLTDAQKAYVMATVKHETADTYRPINEYGRGRGRPYGVPDPETGQTYFGRGYVQLTWKKNYETMSKLIGVDLVNNPELANDPDIAYEILVVGMKEGLFTGVGLDKYINQEKSDFNNARRIVNGTDKAGLIASHANKFKSIFNDTRLASN